MTQRTASWWWCNSPAATITSTAVVPYNNPRYIDNRPNVRLSEDQIIPFDNGYGLNPSMQPVKDLYEAGKVAVIHGVGYPQPNRSHFRSMDIWHTAEPTKVGDKGWLGQGDPGDDAGR